MPSQIAGMPRAKPQKNRDIRQSTSDKVALLEVGVTGAGGWLIVLLGVGTQPVCQPEPVSRSSVTL